MPTGSLLALALLPLTGIFFLTTLLGGLRALRKREPISLKVTGPLFFYRRIQSTLVRGREVDLLLLAIACAQNVLRLSYGYLAALFLMNSQRTSPAEIAIFAMFVLFSLVLGDIVPRLWSIRYPDIALKVASPVSSLVLSILLPITLPFLWVSGRW
ncbi:hypothetical protein SCG7086_BZ_00010, partial [Chlamydiales bacterium SCGC AG-110-P3]